MAASSARRRERSWSGTSSSMTGIWRSRQAARRPQPDGVRCAAGHGAPVGHVLGRPDGGPHRGNRLRGRAGGNARPVCLKGYTARRWTTFEHTAEIAAEYGYRDFKAAAAELAQWVDDRARTTGDGPKALFAGAVAWLRERQVLLPGVTKLAKLVARVRDEAMQRLWDVLAAVVTPAQARMLELLLEVPDGARFSDLERLRNGPRTRSGKAIIERLESLQVDSARDTSAQWTPGGFTTTGSARSISCWASWTSPRHDSRPQALRRPAVSLGLA